MNTYWLSNSEGPESFWEHEWSKHGTCISTIEPSCYSNYQVGEEAVAFFQVVVDLFKSLDTYTVRSEHCPYESDESFHRPAMLTVTPRSCRKPASSHPTLPPTLLARLPRRSQRLSGKTR